MLFTRSGFKQVHVDTTVAELLVNLNRVPHPTHVGGLGVVRVDLDHD